MKSRPTGAAEALAYSLGMPRVMPKVKNVGPAPEVKQWGIPRGGGARGAFFTPEPGITVKVDPQTSDESERALEIAQALACMSRFVLEWGAQEVAYQIQIASLEVDLRAANQQLQDVRVMVREQDRPAARIFGKGTVRFSEKGDIWLLSKRETGWSSFGFMMKDWDELFRRWDVRVTGHGTDEFGPYWNVESTARESGEKK